VSVQAHHAFSSEFDKDLPFIHRGTIVRMEWVNPHTWLHVDVEKEDGTTESWMMEGGTPNTLLRAGMTNVMLQPGTQVIVRTTFHHPGFGRSIFFLHIHMQPCVRIDPLHSNDGTSMNKGKVFIKFRRKSMVSLNTHL
jgi:hypothetical protein